jgi:hypothetical protein
MPVSHQKAVLAVLICAPSTLHKKWKDKKKNEFDQELVRLKLTDKAKSEAQRIVHEIDADEKHRKVITDAAAILKATVWAGDEPHPTDEDAANLVAKAKELDTE